MRRSEFGGVPACYVRTYVRTYVFFPDLRPAKAISQAGYAAKGASQDTYVRTYVRGEFIAGGYASCPGPLSLGIPLLLVCPTTTSDDDDDDNGGGAGVRPEDSCVRAHVAHVPTPVRTHAYFARLGTCVRAICAAQCFLYVRTMLVAIAILAQRNFCGLQFTIRTYVRTLFSAHNSRIITQLLFMDRDGGRDGDEVVMGRDGGHVRPRRGGRAWVETAVREAEEAQQAPMARILIQLVTQDLYSCLAVWLFGQRADLIGVGSRLRHVKNCCRLVTVAFISATLCRRTLHAESRARRDWRGLPRYRLEESFVACGSLIIFPRGDEGKSGIELVEYVQEDRSGGQLAAVIRRYGVPLHGATAVT